MIKFYINLWKMERNAKKLGKDVAKIGNRTNKFVGGFISCVDHLTSGVLSIFRSIRGK